MTLFARSKETEIQVAADILRLHVKFKDANILKQLLLIKLGPEGEACETSGHKAAQEKSTCAHCKAYTNFKLALQQYRRFDNKDIEEIVCSRRLAFSHTENLPARIDILLEELVLENLKTVEEKLDEALQCKVSELEKFSFNRPNGVKDRINNLLTNKFFQAGMRKQFPLPEGCSQADECNIVLKEYAEIFSKCMHCTFIEDLTVTTKLDTFSNALTSRKYDVPWDAPLQSVIDLLNKIPLKYERTQDRIPVDGLQKHLKWLLKPLDHEGKQCESETADGLMKIYKEEYEDRTKGEFSFALHQVLCEIHGLFSESKVKIFEVLGTKTEHRTLDKQFTKSVLGMQDVVDVGLAFGRLLVAVNIDESEPEKIKKIKRKVEMFEETFETKRKFGLLICPKKKSFNEGSEPRSTEDAEDNRADSVDTMRTPSVEGNELERSPVVMHQVGDEVKSINGELYGSLGAFVKIYHGGNQDYEIGGLTSGHIFKDRVEKQVVVKGRKCTPCHVVDFEGKETTQERQFDIELLKFEANTDFADSQIETRFKTSDGQVTATKLRNFEPKDMKILAGKRVHIWGAVTKQGFGRVIAHQVPKRSEVILIERIGTNFSDRGDSGSIVLRDTPDGDVRALSMLQGEDDRYYYVTITLCKGLESLRRRAKKAGWDFSIELCD